MPHRLAVALALLAPAVAAAQTPDPPGTGVGYYVSSNAGVNVNDRLGATAFYAAGYTGTQATVANIEAGHIWNGHETLGHVTTFLNGPGTVADRNGVAAAYDRHATWVGMAIGGRPTAGGGEYQRGMAYGATLWSGSVATSWVGSPYALSFQFDTYAAFFTPYQTAMVTGVGGKTADVVNSSWGFSGDSAGRSIFTMGIDALVAQSAKVMTVSAGNSGSGANTVGGPATGYNVISVAALGADTATPSYNTVSSFSSRGPNDAFTPNAAVGSGTDTGTGTTTANARVRVDIAAPGENQTLAFYGGTTGGNANGTATPGNNLYSTNLAGTSFAAPTVAGGAALMVDAAKANGLTTGTDARVIKTILMTSADKTAGWDNGQTTVNGVVTTTQALDVAVGAGRMNLAAALPFLTSATATRDVPGLTPGNQGPVSSLGWDLGVVNRLSRNDYTVTSLLPAGSTVTATLNWFARRSISGADYTTLADNGLADLNLEIWQVVNGVFTTKVGRSASVFNNSEHLAFAVPADGQYGIRVLYEGDNWRFDGNLSETYAVAWDFVPVPEPGGMVVLAAVVWVVGRRVRRGGQVRV